MKAHNFDFSRKIFFHPEKIVEFKEGKRPFPITMEVDFTNICNHRCSFCNFGEHLKKDHSSLNSELIIERLAEAYKLGTKGICITGGGEPSLHKHFSKMVQKMKQIGFDIGLITNGSMLEGKEGDIIENLQWIRVSMGSGDPGSYKLIEGVDHFDKVINNINTLSKLKNDRKSDFNIGIRIRVTKDNLASLINIANIINKLNIDYLQLAPDQFTEKEDCFWIVKNTRKVFGEVEVILNKSNIMLLKSGFDVAPKRIDYPRTCYTHFFHTGITAEGDVMFCKNSRGNMRKGNEFVLGNINKNTLTEIWNNDKTKELELKTRPNNCGYFCKNLSLNVSLEETLYPDNDMSPNFIS